METHAALVIEDDDAIRALVARLLIRAGFDPVHEAADGASGLRNLRAHDYCVVVLDLWMPNVSGYELIESLRADGLPTKPFIVVLTADAKAASATPPITLDSSLVAAVIRKPFDLESFIETVQRCRDGRDALTGELKTA